MVVYLLMWLAVSAIAILAFAFGSAVGYRRGFDEATAHPGEQPGGRAAASPGMGREIRLPEDVLCPVDLQRADATEVRLDS